eukprot:m.125866 g.125866  ORF g.125866 m.125866 type:complete len:176 (+) comp9384_c0_seq1:95-622(+)
MSVSVTCSEERACTLLASFPLESGYVVFDDQHPQVRPLAHRRVPRELHLQRRPVRRASRSLSPRQHSRSRSPSLRSPPPTRKEHPVARSTSPTAPRTRLPPSGRAKSLIEPLPLTLAVPDAAMQLRPAYVDLEEDLIDWDGVLAVQRRALMFMLTERAPDDAPEADAPLSWMGEY